MSARLRSSRVGAALLALAILPLAGLVTTAPASAAVRRAKSRIRFPRRAKIPSLIHSAAIATRK